MIEDVNSVALVDISTSYDENTGDRYANVDKGKLLALRVDLIGIQTAQLAQSQGFNLSYSVEISRMQYNKEKYCFFDGCLYEIKSLSKSKSPVNMLLNISEVFDDQLKIAVKNWLESIKNDI